MCKRAFFTCFMLLHSILMKNNQLYNWIGREGSKHFTRNLISWRVGARGFLYLLRIDHNWYIFGVNYDKLFDNLCVKIWNKHKHLSPCLDIFPYKTFSVPGLFKHFQALVYIFCTRFMRNSVSAPVHWCSLEVRV